MTKYPSKLKSHCRFKSCKSKKKGKNNIKGGYYNDLTNKILTFIEFVLTDKSVSFNEIDFILSTLEEDLFKLNDTNKKNLIRNYNLILKQHSKIASKLDIDSILSHRFNIESRSISLDDLIFTKYDFNSFVKILDEQLPLPSISSEYHSDYNTLEKMTPEITASNGDSVRTFDSYRDLEIENRSNNIINELIKPVKSDTPESGYGTNNNNNSNSNLPE